MKFAFWMIAVLPSVSISLTSVGVRAMTSGKTKPSASASVPSSNRIQVQEWSSEAPTCESRHLLTINADDGERWLFVIPAQKDEFVFHLSGHESLVVPVRGDERIESRSAPFASQATRALTSRERRIADRFRALAPGGSLEALLQQCRSVPEKDRRPAVALPLSPVEKKACMELVEEFRDLRGCFERADCAQVETQYFKGPERREPRRYSFRQFIETGRGELSAKMIALGTASAASWTWDLTVVRALIKNRASLALTFTRAGVVVGGAAASAISFTFVPAAAYIFGDDSCRPSTPKKDFDFSDCLGKTAVQLTPIFRAQISRALETPDDFAKSLDEESRAVESRLACMMVENIVTGYEDLRRSVRCQGRVLEIGGESSYLVGAEDELTRHQDGFYSHVFNFKIGTHRIVKRAAGLPDLRATEKVKTELENLKILAPRIQDVLAGCRP